MRILFFLFFGLVGCAGAPPGPSARDVQECQQLIAQYHIDDTRTAMRRCLAVTPETVGLPGPLPESAPYNPGYAHGPYGQMGPSWAQFNSAFQGPYPPLPPPHRSQPLR
jgi:hypothetical protein